MNEAVAIVSGLATLALFFRVFFPNTDDFIAAVKFWLTPDLFSLFRGEYFEDWWAEMKLGLWFGSAAFVGFSVYALLT